MIVNFQYSPSYQRQAAFSLSDSKDHPGYKSGINTTRLACYPQGRQVDHKENVRRTNDQQS